MARRRLLWQLYPSYLLITFGVLVAVLWYGSHLLQSFHQQVTADGLEGRARLASTQIREALLAEGNGNLDELCAALSEHAEARLTVVDEFGDVLGDSHEDSERMENHADRPEIAHALRGEVGQAVRRSRTLRRTMMYVAVPLRSDRGRVTHVVRASVPLASMQQTIGWFSEKVLLWAVIVALVAAAASLYASRRIVKPLQELQGGAEWFARGDLKHKVPVPKARELASLAEAMNQMAERLDQRVGTVLQQRNELEAVLRSMVEGVLAVDAEDRVLIMNRAAAGLLGTDAGRAVGRTIQEIVRNPGLHQIINRALGADELVEGEVTLPGEEGELHLHVRGTVLRGTEGEPAGTLLALNDVTRLRRLERMRQDFVANVSHELRTPITVIKGFAETLLEQQEDDARKRERFLSIIVRQADRLQMLFNDLLTLSRTEREVEAGEVSLEQGALDEVVESAVALCRTAAETKDVHVELECEGKVRIPMNAALLEQAVFNLVDNAVTYSPAGSSIRVEARREGQEARISVRDEGPGIPSEHLPRIFERFYRVDRGRDRKSGGTGLGLAIVKHIAQAHGGRVDVQTTLGKGSTFTIYLPSE